jgi:hypothetical protein
VEDLAIEEQESDAVEQHVLKVAEVDVAFVVLQARPGTTRTQRRSSPATRSIDFGPRGPACECSIDGGAFTSCAPPFTAAGLAAGPHTLDVRAVDADGRPDPSPAHYAFDVPARSSSVAVNPLATDLDRDQIPDTQETLPLGNVPPVAGVRTLASLVSGTVYVKLPATAPCAGSSCVRTRAGRTCQTAPPAALPRLASCSRGKRRIAAYSTAD